MAHEAPPVFALRRTPRAEAMIAESNAAARDEQGRQYLGGAAQAVRVRTSGSLVRLAGSHDEPGDRS